MGKQRTNDVESKERKEDRVTGWKERRHVTAANWPVNAHYTFIQVLTYRKCP